MCVFGWWRRAVSLALAVTVTVTISVSIALTITITITFTFTLFVAARLVLGVAVASGVEVDFVWRQDVAGRRDGPRTSTVALGARV